MCATCSRCHLPVFTIIRVRSYEPVLKTRSLHTSFDGSPICCTGSVLHVRHNSYKRRVAPTRYCNELQQRGRSLMWLNILPWCKYRKIKQTIEKNIILLKNYQTKNVLPTQQQFSVCVIYRLNSVSEKIILEFTSCYCSYCDGLKYTVNKYDRPCVCFLLGVRTIIINKRTFSSTAPRAYKFSGNKESYYIFIFFFIFNFNWPYGF